MFLHVILMGAMSSSLIQRSSSIIEHHRSLLIAINYFNHQQFSTSTIMNLHQNSSPWGIAPLHTPVTSQRKPPPRSSHVRPARDHCAQVSLLELAVHCSCAVLWKPCKSGCYGCNPWCFVWFSSVRTDLAHASFPPRLCYEFVAFLMGFTP